MSKEKCNTCGIPTKVAVRVFLGLLFVFSGLVSVIVWWDQLWAIVKGIVGILLILLGAVILLVAKD